MELILMTLTTGIMVGGIYALVALGWVLIYKCSGVFNKIFTLIWQDTNKKRNLSNSNSGEKQFETVY